VTKNYRAAVQSQIWPRLSETGNYLFSFFPTISPGLLPIHLLRQRRKEEKRENHEKTKKAKRKQTKKKKRMLPSSYVKED
jgi:hypothetical protein